MDIEGSAINRYLSIDRHKDVKTNMSDLDATTTERILAAAEARVRSGGYHAVSFRDVAADVGIKSSSVHHHFPTKEDLGVAVAQVYTDRFMAALGDPEDPQREPGALLALYVDLFRGALRSDRRMCLCGVLAAETAGLPLGVNAVARAFFTRNVAWLESVLKRRRPRPRPERAHDEALKMVATLEGATLLAHTLASDDVFERIAASIDV